MGGFGIGREGWRPHLEACPAVLDANEAGRELRNQTGRPLHCGTTELAATYQTLGNDGGMHDVTHRLRLEIVPCRFGGTPAFFLCHRCEGRVVKLYLCRGAFRCHGCHGLAFASERMGEYDRALLQAGKIKRRLGGDPDILGALPEAPERHVAADLRARAAPLCRGAATD